MPVPDYLTNVGGLAVSTALFDGVSATAAGIGIAGAIIAVPQWLFVAGLRRGAPHASGRADNVAYGCVWTVLMFAGLFLLPALVAIANAALTGFVLEGFSSYVATVACIYVVGYLIGRLPERLVLHRRPSS